MWILESLDPEFKLLFRMLPGPAKTMGRAPRADFIVDAPLVSRLHCRLNLETDQLDELVARIHRVLVEDPDPPVVPGRMWALGLFCTSR